MVIIKIIIKFYQNHNKHYLHNCNLDTSINNVRITSIKALEKLTEINDCLLPKLKELDDCLKNNLLSENNYNQIQHLKTKLNLKILRMTREIKDLNEMAEKEQQNSQAKKIINNCEKIIDK